MVALGFLLVMGSSVSVLAVHAAQKIKSFHNIAVQGELSSMPYTGKMTVTNFTTSEDGIAARVRLDAQLKDQEGGMAGTSMTVPVSVHASCKVLNLTFGPVNVDLSFLVPADIQMDAVEVKMESGKDKELQSLFCKMERQQQSGNAAGSIVETLNQILNATGSK